MSDTAKTVGLQRNAQFDLARGLLATPKLAGLGWDCITERISEVLYLMRPVSAGMSETLTGVLQLSHHTVQIRFRFNPCNPLCCGKVAWWS
jgi:hypothetical protein